MIVILFKSIIHNIFVTAVVSCFIFLGTVLDSLFGIGRIDNHTVAVGVLLFLIGFLLRVWATFYFYDYKMKVISLRPQKNLITSGPYRFSRNPLYLGGTFIFFGVAFSSGSPIGIFIALLSIFASEMMIRREEKQLKQNFGEEWQKYKKRTRKWV